jgi:hypothetical protein
VVQLNGLSQHLATLVALAAALDQELTKGQE